jgi:dTDP-4-amino-4,6-dideoxygalactose transaminase
MYQIGDEEIRALKRVFAKGDLFRYLDDSETEAFETELAAVIGVRHAIAVNSGTSALICALAGLGIGPGDEVIVPGYTFMASASAVLAVGAIPIIAEIDETLTIDHGDAEQKITERTKAVMPVHICGMPANMDALQDLARRYGLTIIEDACQADGGSYRGRRLGSIGDAGAFSFNYYKIISAGEGGAVLCNDEDIFQRAFIEHDSGTSFRPIAAEIKHSIFTAYNFRISEPASAILRVQLQRLDSILNELRRVKTSLRERVQLPVGVMETPTNDAAGDCGTVFSFLFETEKACLDFHAAMKSTPVTTMRPIDSGRHVYTNWKPIIDRNVFHHRELNPFYFEANRACRPDYSPDACPKTLDLLRRSCLLYPPYNADDARLEETAESINHAFV